MTLEFVPPVADFVKAREWHQSQTWHDQPDGGGIMTLDVCIDKALESWLLGFGPSVKVIDPAALRQQVARLHDEAARRYVTSSTTL